MGCNSIEIFCVFLAHISEIEVLIGLSSIDSRVVTKRSLGFRFYVVWLLNFFEILFEISKFCGGLR